RGRRPSPALFPYPTLFRSALGGASTYFGSVDATPLFVALVDRAARWGARMEEIRALMPAVDAAMEWILHYGDRDGDGFVEYRRQDRKSTRLNSSHVKISYA